MKRISNLALDSLLKSELLHSTPNVRAILVEADAPLRGSVPIRRFERTKESVMSRNALKGLMATPPFALEALTMTEEGHQCPWCSSPVPTGLTAVRVTAYPANLPEDLRGFYFHSVEHLRSWAQQAALNAMRLIATNDPTYIAHPTEILARRDAYSALAQVTFPQR